MKTLDNILRVLVVTALAIYLALITLGNTGVGERWLARQVSEQLSSMVGARVSVERANLGLFNQVTLHGVKLDDPERNEVLRGNYISAKIDVWPLLSEHRVILRSVALLDTDVKLRRKADGKLNIQYLIDAFSNPNDTTPTHLDLTAGVVLMRRCTVDYSDALNPQREIGLRDIDLNVQLRHLTNDSLLLRVRNCAMKELRGLDVKHLTLALEAGKKGGSVSDLELRLPGSYVKVPKLTAHYDGGPLNVEHLIRSAEVEPFRLEAHVQSADLAGLLPDKALRALGGENAEADVKLEAAMADQHLKVSRINVEATPGQIALRASGDARLEGTSLAGFNANVEKAEADMPYVGKIYSVLSGKTLPDAVKAMGRASVKGTLGSKGRQNADATFDLLTDIGKAYGQISKNGQRLAGKITCNGLQLAKALPGKNVPEQLDFNFDGSGTADGKSVAGVLDVRHLTWRGHSYSGIHAKGAVANGAYDLQVLSKDPMMNLALDASGDTGLNNAEVKAVIQKWSAFLPKNFRDVSGSVNASLHNIKGGIPSGRIELNDVDVTVNAGDSLTVQHIGNLTAESTPSGENSVNVRLNSDFLQGTWHGSTDIAAIKTAALSIVNRHVPNLIVPQASGNANGRWSFALNVLDGQLLQSLLKIPVEVNAPMNLEGYIDGTAQRALLQMDAPSLSIKGNDLERVRLFAACNPEGGETLLQADKATGKKKMNLNLRTVLNNGGLLTTLNWREPAEQHYYGEVGLLTDFGKTADGKQTVDMKLMPTDFVVNDTVWHVTGGELRYANNRLDVNSCEVAQGIMQHARIDGCYSRQESDSIVAHLKGIDIEYILDLVNFHAVDFAGKANGTAVVKMQSGRPHVDFDLLIPRFLFNNTNMGEANVVGDFNAEQKRINLSARMIEQGEGSTMTRGYVSLADKALDLHFQSNRTPLGFLNRFVSGILEDIEGRATGNLHLYGGFKKLDFGGSMVADASLTIPVTRVRYNITSAKADFTPGLIAFRDGHFNDGHEGTGTVEGTLRHEYIKNMRYHFEAEVNNAYVYDVPQQIDWNFFSTARGNGRVVLDGRPGRLQTDINFTPTQGTDFTFINDTPETVTNGQFVHFGSKRQENYLPAAAADTLQAPATLPEAPKMDIYLNFNINVTPDAALHIVMDEKCGDVINLYGRGNVMATWYNKGDFQMYGNCLVDHGEYRFSIQDVIRKNFQLKPGGEVTFAGNPMDANLDVQAIYTVNSASLADLNAGANFSDNTVRVNCLLNIQGRAGAPEISFDLDLPNVNEDEKQMVRKLIATEEDMNMQIIYLLGVGRFYTYDAASQSENGLNQLATNSVNSFISNTLSSQLNEMISNALHTNNWSFGANLATGQQGWNDMEVEALLSGRLFNNRLLLNGQFGYRDKATLATNTNFIGDFDIQYLLTKSGNVRLKAYSETNDRYFTKSALTTQGIGIMLQRDFGRIEDKLKRRKQKQQSKESSETEQQ